MSKGRSKAGRGREGEREGRSEGENLYTEGLVREGRREGENLRTERVSKSKRDGSRSRGKGRLMEGREGGREGGRGRERGREKTYTPMK